MKIYLDTCAIQRPLDTKTQIRIILFLKKANALEAIRTHVVSPLELIEELEI